MASRDSSWCWARSLPITVKFSVCRTWSWTTPAGRRPSGCPPGGFLPRFRDWERAGALGFSLSIGKPLSSLVVRPSHRELRSRRGPSHVCSGVVLLALSVRQATRPESSPLGHIHSRERVCPAGGGGGGWRGAFSLGGGAWGAQGGREPERARS